MDSYLFIVVDHFLMDSDALVAMQWGPQAPCEEIDAMAKNVLSDHEVDTTYYPQPHHPSGFTDIPLASRNHPIRGLRCRAIMMSNLPRTLRI